MPGCTRNPGTASLERTIETVEHLELDPKT